MLNVQIKPAIKTDSALCRSFACLNSSIGLCILGSHLEQAQDPSCSHVIQMKECVNNYGLEWKLTLGASSTYSEKNFFVGAKNLKKLLSVIQIHFTREIFFVKQTMRFKEKQL